LFRTVVNRSVPAQVACTYFFAGDFLEASGPHEDIQTLTLRLQFRFKARTASRPLGRRFLPAHASEEFLPHLCALSFHLGTDFDSDVASSGGYTACLAGEHWFEEVAAALVHQARWRRLALPLHPTIPPMCHRNNDGVKLQALFGEAILESQWPLLISGSGDDAEFLETLESIGESAGRDTGMRLEDFKSARAEKEFSNEKQGPAFAHHADGAGDGAGEVFDFGFTHRRVDRPASHCRIGSD
jgi:hypothetical protein